MGCGSSTHLASFYSPALSPRRWPATEIEDVILPGATDSPGLSAFCTRREGTPVSCLPPTLFRPQYHFPPPSSPPRYLRKSGLVCFLFVFASPSLETFLVDALCRAEALGSLLRPGQLDDDALLSEDLGAGFFFFFFRVRPVRLPLLPSFLRALSPILWRANSKRKRRVWAGRQICP